ncbi:hypothetical protein DPMN_174970 [Dreissena polymorpha]|uniref:Uncharacterized protein n=1 Tax=Dreissena polymorpha TaxID=45954 RepID=A0A9D4E6D0_DREPO|nr:hypothetical protein DPMN_174970 [Dreissena polymorpha]
MFCPENARLSGNVIGRSCSILSYGGMPVTRQQVNAVLAKFLGRTEFGNALFKTHSFRIGRATDLSRKEFLPKSSNNLGDGHQTHKKAH